MKAFSRILSVGRPREVALPSSLPAVELLAQLKQRRASRGQLVRQSFSFGLAPRIVVGDVSPQKVVLTALRPGVRNSWRPRFQGRVVPTQSGSEVLGTIAWSRVVLGLTLVWIAFIAVLTLIGLATALAGVFTAHSSWALHGVAFTGGCLGILGLGCALFAVAGAWGRRDEEYLRHWLSQAAGEPAHTERNSG